MYNTPNMSQKASVLIATSSDPRYQQAIHDWILKMKLYGKHIRLSISGCVKDRETLMKNIRNAVTCYDVKDLYLINVENDPAYANRKFASSQMEKEAHVNDLHNTQAAIKAEMPKLKTYLYFINKKLDLELIP